MIEPRNITLTDGRRMVIRPLAVTDGEALASFYADIPPEDGIYYLPPSGRTRNMALRYAAEADASADVVLVLADDSGTVHGEAWYRYKGEQRERATFGICVLRTAQGCGAGRALMGRLLEIADESGPAVIELTVQTENERARRLYERMGFEIVKKQMREEREDAPPMPEYAMERRRKHNADHER